MNYQAWWFWISVVQIVITSGLGIFVWWSNREKVTSTRFTALENEVRERVKADDHREIENGRDNRCRKHQDRTAKLEIAFTRVDSELTHLPSQRTIDGLAKEMRDLKSQLGDFKGQFGEVVGRLAGLNRAVDLMNEFLLNQGKRGP